MNIEVAGTGYVGLSLAALLARRNRVIAVDDVPRKVGAINAGRSPIADAEIESALGDAELFGSEVTRDLGSFKRRCGVVVVNRWSDELAYVAGKVHTRDLFRRD